jgi:hypothetical protein
VIIPRDAEGLLEREHVAETRLALPDDHDLHTFVFERVDHGLEPVVIGLEADAIARDDRHAGSPVVDRGLDIVAELIPIRRQDIRETTCKYGPSCISSEP